MSIEVRWFPILAKQSRSKQPHQTLDWRQGLTAHQLLAAEGFRPHDAEAVMVIINGAQSELDTLIKDGDAVELMVSIQGGVALRR